jgi:hypothetical protein
MLAFDAFQQWCAAHPGKGPRGELTESRYYASSTFRDEFFEFIQNSYAPRDARTPRILLSILDYERALIHETPPPKGTPPEEVDASDVNLVPRIAKGVVITECAADYNRIVRCLRRKGDLRRVPRKSATIATRQHVDKRLDVIHLSPLSAQLLKLCDGERTVSEIASRLTSPKGAIADIPKDKVCLFGLEVLRQQGLIAMYGDPAANAAPS